MTTISPGWHESPEARRRRWVVAYACGWTLPFAGLLLRAIGAGALGNVLLWAGLVAMGAGEVWAAVTQRRWDRRLRSGLCPACGYDTRATPMQCPECGWGQRTGTEDFDGAAGRFHDAGPGPLEEQIRQFVRLSDGTGTAGQPAADQYGAIRRASYDVVINLAMPTSPGALPDEGELVTRHGMTYVHIPVDFQAPAASDVHQFFDVMDDAAARGQRVFVHCATNKRASTFMYLYRVARQRVPEPVARRDLHRVWVPDETWQRLIEEVV